MHEILYSQLVRLQVLLYFHYSKYHVAIILCAAFYTRLIIQSRDHDEVSIKTEHKILIYDQQSEWKAPQNDGRRTEKQKVTRT